MSNKIFAILRSKDRHIWIKRVQPESHADSYHSTGAWLEAIATGLGLRGAPDDQVFQEIMREVIKEEGALYWDDVPKSFEFEFLHYFEVE